MKTFLILALVLVLALGLCACRMGGKNEETTPTTDATEPPATTTPSETEPLVDPTIMDPTLAPNIPDPSVDDDHLIDPTDDGILDNIVPDIKGRIDGLK